MFFNLRDQVAPLTRFTLPARGLRTSSPPQFGQIEFISSVHALQKLHS
jgi:hypothetical protein